MARWKLMNPHYLNVKEIDGEEIVWEYKETDRNTGRQARKRFPIPYLLDPKDPTLQNRAGDIIVSDGHNAVPGDIIFFGEPTPDMMPIDDEAKAISEKLAPKWQHPIDTLPANGDFSLALIRTFEKQMSDLVKQGTIVPNVSSNGIDPEAFKALQDQVKALMEQNAKLQEAATKPDSASVSGRRI